MNRQSRSPFGMNIPTKSIIFSALRGRIAQTLVCAAIPATGLLFPVNAVAQQAEPKIKVLAKAADPLKMRCLSVVSPRVAWCFNCRSKVRRRCGCQWAIRRSGGAHKPSETELYHVELKLTDPTSQDPYSLRQHHLLPQAIKKPAKRSRSRCRQCGAVVVCIIRRIAHCSARHLRSV